jgi:hypothetical protein
MSGITPPLVGPARLGNCHDRALEAGPMTPFAITLA